MQDYPEAVSNCAAWSQHEFAAYDPSVIVLMGREVVQSIFGLESSVVNTRGQHLSLPAKHSWRWNGYTGTVRERVAVCTYDPGAAHFAGGVDSEPGQFIVQDLMSARRTMEALVGA